MKANKQATKATRHYTCVEKDCNSNVARNLNGEVGANFRCVKHSREYYGKMACLLTLPSTSEYSCNRGEEGSC